jgi:hypothetical protein
MPRHIPERTCFVICPIGEPDSPERLRPDQVFKFIITPAAGKHGLTCLRSDHIASPGGNITNETIRHILEDRVVIADLTGRNANVFYELGLRHSFRKPVVQLITRGERVPFDVQGTRVVYYTLDLAGGQQAKEEIEQQIAAALDPNFAVESPVTFAARAALEDVAHTAAPKEQLMLEAVLDQINDVRQRLSDISTSMCRPQDLREALPREFQNRIADILARYAEEIELVKAVRFAGVSAIYRRREQAIKAFARAIDAETREITIIGSSLKGLLLNEEYKDISEKLRFKADKGLVKIRLLLTHPIMADFRARQEGRGFAEIGDEIIQSLTDLKQWNRTSCRVKLYLGAPTCFAIKTSQQMLINPYPYRAVSYESPCLVVESSLGGGTERPGYFYDMFDSGHFSAWDTDLAVEVDDFDRVISTCRSMLQEYAKHAQNVLTQGRFAQAAQA